VRDLGPALWAMLLVPLLSYLATWWGWLGSETAIDRHTASGTTGPPGLPGPTWIPDALRGLWYYGGKVLEFHETLVTDPAHPHPWESKPFAWPMGLRPMLYHYAGPDRVTGCGSDKCVQAVMLIGTPALWWPSLLIIAFALWRVLARFDWRYAAVLVGYGAGILPWFLNLDRQMYFFYMTPVVPFLVLGTVLVMGEVLGRAGASTERRQTGLLVVGLWVGVVVANFIWLWPILVGKTIPEYLWQMELWLPSWTQNS
jgi:dolichyl-phosphate-mannose-protein mannosyltransferase